jgi:hypothetical protein
VVAAHDKRGRRQLVEERPCRPELAFARPLGEITTHQHRGRARRPQVVEQGLGKLRDLASEVQV